MRTTTNRFSRHALASAATALVALPLAIASDLGTTGGDFGTEGPATRERVAPAVDRYALPPAVWSEDPLGVGIEIEAPPKDARADGCLSDVDQSGAVDFEDFLYILINQGAQHRAYDLDNSGMVDFSDLLHVIIDQGCTG
ncbi:MAG: hypothetical protein AB8G96_16235 [Phycisphaerales bacterium]